MGLSLGGAAEAALASEAENNIGFEQGIQVALQRKL